LREEQFILLWLVKLFSIIVLRVDRGVVHMVVGGDIVDHYCLMFDRGVVILLTSTVSCLTEELFISL
jgi:hypothetical protein